VWDLDRFLWLGKSAIEAATTAFGAAYQACAMFRARRRWLMAKRWAAWFFKLDPLLLRNFPAALLEVPRARSTSLAENSASRKKFMRQWLETAGRFTVEPIGGIPHFAQTVDASAPPTGVLHTTEGSRDSSLAVFRRHYAPHFLVSAGRIEQLVPVGFIGAAMVTHNWLAVVQVEVVAYSKETPWFFDDATAEAVAALMAACKAEYGIPLSRPWPDGVYGMARANDPHRNGGQFGKVAGWYGHGDAPSPDSHWDPGNLQWSKLFEVASGAPYAPQPPDPAPPRLCAGGPDLQTVAGYQAALAFKIDVDGGAGPQTAAVLRAFQAIAGLPATGAIDDATRTALTKDLAAISG
jgi:Putative peptidoglycan binding domain/N-acetylmuramoyl-L-alanine amidase